MEHTPLGRTADKPENPMDDMSANLLPMNAMPLPMRSPDTLAQKRDSFFTKQGSAANAQEGSPGPDSPMTKPGGNHMMDDIGSYQPLTTAMTYAKEGDDSYIGSESIGKIIKGDRDQLEQYGV